MLAQPAPVPPAVSAAAEPGANAVTHFPAAFFAAARPNTALDMIERVPGFSVDPGETLRGFGAAAGNVLVNGSRPSTKTDTLTQLLQRIPASAVERIELIRSGTTGVDMQGRVILANVVLFAGARNQVVLIAGSRAYADGRVAPVGQADWSRNGGRRSFSASMLYYDQDGGEHGAGAGTVRSESGLVLDAGRVERTDIDRGVRLRGSVQTPLLGGVVRLNASFNRDVTDKSQRFIRQPGFGAPGSDVIVERRRITSGEIGGDFRRKLGSNAELTLVALQSLRRRHYQSASDEAGLSTAFSQSQASGESILRGSATYTVSPALGFRVGAEGVFNFFEGRSQYAENGVQIQLPNARIRVEERRGEAFGSSTWALAPSLSLEAGIRIEASTITQAGDSNRSASFLFPKPRTLLSWAPAPAWETRLRLEREVGQLDFADFAASANFANGTVNAGNPDLEPERRWVIEAAVEHRFSGQGALIVTANHARLQQVIDQVPVNGFSAPGNIGSGRRDSVRLALTLPLRAFGMRGGLLNLDLRRLWSRVTDPTTGDRRMISRDVAWTGSVKLSNDMPKLRSTWTLTGSLGPAYREYRISEILAYRFGPQFGFAWEYKPSERLSILLELSNLTGRVRDFTRFGYAGLRSDVPLGFVENQSIRFPRHAHFRIRRTF